jgi:hypothetical protein
MMKKLFAGIVMASLSISLIGCAEKPTTPAPDAAPPAEKSADGAKPAEEPTTPAPGEAAPAPADSGKAP